MTLTRNDLVALAVGSLIGLAIAVGVVEIVGRWRR